MKTQEELNAHREEVEALNENLSALTEEELREISAGADSTTDSMKIILWNKPKFVSQTSDKT